jgi:predicted metal-dependent phosphotriesterase family hydrolase
MPFVRTILGDIAAADLGITYAHEHLVIDGGRPVQLFPDFRLDSVEDAVAELAPAQALGLRAVVDAIPADRGIGPAEQTLLFVANPGRAYAFAAPAA